MGEPAIAGKPGAIGAAPGWCGQPFAKGAAMELSLWGTLIVGASAPAVVVRFARPDLEDYLPGDAGRCELFQELQEAALGGLGAGETLILNLQASGPALPRSGSSPLAERRPASHPLGSAVRRLSLMFPESPCLEIWQQRWECLQKLGGRPAA
jgi:hypothetical protein